MDIITYALLKKRITSALTGIADVRLTPDGKSLEFETTDGTVFTITIPQKDIVYVGPTAPNPADYELWVDTTDPGSTPSGGVCTYTNPSVGRTVGGVKAGTAFNKTPIQDVLDMLFAPDYAKPTITIGINPTKTLYDSVTETLSSIKLTANVTKKSEDIDFVKFYVDGVLVETVTTGVAAGGTFSYNYTFPAPTNKTFTVKVEARDVTTHSVVSSQTTVTFIGKSYHGVIEDGTAINETNIKALTPDLKNKLGATYDYTAVYGRFVYAYPSSLGTVSTAKDLVNNFNYTDSITKGTIMIDGISYNLVYLTDPMGYDDLRITFA